MKIFLLKQTINNTWDTYDSCVVVAENQDAAKRCHPCHHSTYLVDEKGYFYQPNDYEEGKRHYNTFNAHGTWVANIKDISAEYLGEAREGHPGGVICSSFNAG